MALTRITGTVIEDNAITTDKIGNAAITGAMIATGAISADKLAANTSTAGPIPTQIAAVNLALSANTNSVKANVDAAEANVAAIKDATTDLDIASGKFFFDKSAASLGIANGNPVASSLTLGSPGNVIINYGGATAKGNVLIGTADPTTAFRLDVRGTANTGAITATSVTLSADAGLLVPNDGNIGSAGATDAMQISSGGIVTFKDDIKIKDGGTIGTATDPDAVTIAAAGAVTFSQRDIHSSGITVADGGQIGSATTAAAITIAADGLVTVSDDLSVTGNLTVLGATTTVNTENLVIQDNFMALANSQPFDSATTLDSGIFFNRGSAGNAALYYDQSITGFRLSETRDPFANAAISPTHDANLTLSNLFAETMKIKGADVATMIADNRSGAVSTVFNTNLTASRALASDGSGKIAVSDVTATELGHLDGVSSGIQTQLDSKIATTDSASNDFITFARLNANVNVVSANTGGVETRLNANLDVVQDNVTAITGGGTLLKLHSNSNVQAAGSTANTFFIGVAMPGDGLANIISVALDGVTQQKDVPSGTFAANNDFVMNAVAAHASIKFTAPSIPVGSTVIITALKA